ncbi:MULTISPECIES: ABC transporter permease subunit [Rhodomicrobium]|uniref:ABC transporter permease n=1 Tax=Rhodomicrobium TaxID=1068 RepID=UPI000B4B107E|nr:MULTISPECIES: ABC transporter permease subunit [Rhodomicrobium]
MTGALGLLSFGDGGWGDELLRGTLVTLQLAVCALALGLSLGLLLSAMKLSKHRLPRYIGDLYIAFIRATPEFLILLLFYFGIERAVQAVLVAVGLDVAFEMPRFLAAVIGLAAIFSAYAAEVFRGAYMAVPNGQIEAAIACGMSDWQTFNRVRLPQMWRFAIPGLGNLWMVLLKDTSLAAVIAVDDLLRQAKIGSESTRAPLTFYLAAGAIYLVLTGVSDLARNGLERRARRGMAGV